MSDVEKFYGNSGGRGWITISHRAGWLAGGCNLKAHCLLPSAFQESGVSLFVFSRLSPTMASSINLCEIFSQENLNNLAANSKAKAEVSVMGTGQKLALDSSY